MRIDLDNWEDEFSSAVLYRGRDYAQEGHIQAMMVVGSTIHAKVRGNWLYDVTIGMDGHTITHMDLAVRMQKMGVIVSIWRPYFMNMSADKRMYWLNHLKLL